jgi:hypothetical protein
MNEDFLQFIWKHKLFCEDSLTTPSGDTIAVLDTGQHNSDAGPDFVNARLRFDSVTWAGNIEIHKNASDWFRHKHDSDKAYDNVILHLVQKNDSTIKRSNGETIPTLILDYDRKLEINYCRLLESSLWIPCQKKINTIDSITMSQWLTRLAVERIERKTEYFSSLLILNKNNWEETFYQALARGFGMNVNALPFEMLAKSLPLTILAHHRDNRFQLEALLFGQAGMLEEKDGDDHYLELKKEYVFLKHKYSLMPIEKHLWKFLRLRPNNFPTLRISQLAGMINKTEFLFSGLIENITRKNVEQILSVEASGYWKNHFQFNKEQSKQVKKIFADTAMNSVVINTIVPFLFIYANKKGLQEVKDKAIQLLENIEPEQNAIIKKFASMDISAINSLETQALIELKNEYCSKKKCLDCRIGNIIIMKN